MKVKLLKHKMDDWDLIAFEYDLDENTIYDAVREDGNILISHLLFKEEECLIIED